MSWPALLLLFCYVSLLSIFMRHVRFTVWAFLRPTFLVHSILCHTAYFLLKMTATSRNVRVAAVAACTALFALYTIMVLTTSCSLRAFLPKALLMPRCSSKLPSFILPFSCLRLSSINWGQFSVYCFHQPHCSFMSTIRKDKIKDPANGSFRL